MNATSQWKLHGNGFWFMPNVLEMVPVSTSCLSEAHLEGWRKAEVGAWLPDL